ncbi:MAG: DUF4292 domain-containing protein [Ferruginibacter sp.]
MQPKETNSTALYLSEADSIQMVESAYSQLIGYKKSFGTFQAKTKIESSGAKGKNPDVTALIKIKQDSAIWISLTATILNVEVYRVLITKDSLVLMNKQDKEVQYRSITYLQELIQAPFDYQTLEDLIVGQPVFLSDSVINFGKSTNALSMTLLGDFFKHLITWNPATGELLQSKLDDIDLSRNRTIYMQYDKHENRDGFVFARERRLFASEKNTLEVFLEFKSYEWGIPLSIQFNVPKNYKKK